MKHYWNDEKKKYGFYLVGFFPKGKMCKYCINLAKENGNLYEEDTAM